jgi:hypothetical protein
LGDPGQQQQNRDAKESSPFHRLAPLDVKVSAIGLATTPGILLNGGVAGQSRAFFFYRRRCAPAYDIGGLAVRIRPIAQPRKKPFVAWLLRAQT